MQNMKKKHLLIVWTVMVSLAMLVLMVLQYHAFREYNEIRAFKAAEFLIADTEKIIAGNDADRENLHDFLKESYLEKARATAYIIDSQPELPGDPKKLRGLAGALGVDQIHIFDETGTIISSTDPKYPGLTMDDGDQIRFFKPMLEDRSLSMSQNVAPNTAEDRIMLYAACWNSDKTRIVQVGAYGERFPRLLNRNRIDLFLDLIPDDPACEIILTDRDRDQIVASTNDTLVGKNLFDIGIRINRELSEEQVDFGTGFDSNPIYCSAKQHKDYTIFIAQYQKKIDENIPVTLFTFAEYLILVFIVMSFIVDYYYDRFMEEKTHAMRDKLTDLYSRRAYEMRLSELEEENVSEDLVFVSMDVNGLKVCNDTLGHQAGDTLLKGAAQCMLKCFGSFGQVFRFGGDEFAAIILVKDVEIPPLKAYLQDLCRIWSRENHIDMSISIGFARRVDHLDANVHTLEAMADQEMYADKARFYEKANHDRRGVSNEGK